MGTYKSFKGSAGAVNLGGALGPTTATILATGDISGWPDGGDGRAFVLELEPGTDNTERVLCALLTVGTPSSIAVLARGWDGTAAISHSPGVVIEHVLDADTVDDLERHAYDTTRDDHVQYLTVPRHDTTARHSFGLGGALGVPGAPADIGAAAAAGTGPRPATENHVHTLGAGVVLGVHVAAKAIDNAQLADNAVDARVLAQITSEGEFGGGLMVPYVSETTPDAVALGFAAGQWWYKPTLKRVSVWDGSAWVIIANGPYLRYVSASTGTITNGSPVDVASWGLTSGSLTGEETESFTSGVTTNRTTFTWPTSTAGVYNVRCGMRLAGGTSGSDQTYRALVAVFGSGSRMLDNKPAIGTASLVLQGGVEMRCAAGETLKVTIQQNSSTGVDLAPALGLAELEIRWVRP